MKYEKSPYVLYFGKDSHAIEYPVEENNKNTSIPSTPSSSAEVDELKKKLAEAEKKIKELEENNDEQELLNNIEGIVNEI